LLQWLEFTKLNGIVIQGNGIINGRGQQWWTYSDPEDEDDDDTYDVELERMPQIKPTVRISLIFLHIMITYRNKVMINLIS
jgi:hypothetical protein